VINPNREIRPEDFAHDPDRIFYSDREGLEKRRRHENDLAELKRLYHLQEEVKAKARFKAEQARKEQIPFSEWLALEICNRVSAGEFLINICKDEDMPTVRSVTQWKKDNHTFRSLYDEAINDRLAIFQDENRDNRR
jgi:hypothetical protein